MRESLGWGCHCFKPAVTTSLTGRGQESIVEDGSHANGTQIWKSFMTGSGSAVQKHTNNLKVHLLPACPLAPQLSQGGNWPTMETIELPTTFWKNLAKRKEKRGIGLLNFFQAPCLLSTLLPNVLIPPEGAHGYLLICLATVTGTF